MSTHIPDDSVSKSQAATPRYIPPIEDHTPELKKLDERIRKEFESNNLRYGEIMSLTKSNPKLSDSIISKLEELLNNTELTEESMKAIKDALKAGVPIKEIIEKYANSYKKDMGV